MELRPADLGSTFAVNIIEARATTYQASRRGGRLSGAFNKHRATNTPGSVGSLERFLTQGSGLTGESQARAAAAVVPMTQGMMVGAVASSIGFLLPICIFISQGEFAPAAMFGTMLAGMTGLFIGFPISMTRKWMSSPLTEEELVNLIVAKEGNSLQQSYLRLVRDVLKQTNIPAEAQEGLREALRSLSEAMTKLPSFSASSQTSAVELRRNAQAVQARADAESDPVTQASLSRQADALDRSAQAAERSSVLIKRTTALQEELAAQIEALRLGLTAFYSGDTDIAGLSSLSENVRVVAAEAISVSDARLELDATPTYATPTIQPAQTISIGR